MFRMAKKNIFVLSLTFAFDNGGIRNALCRFTSGFNSCHIVAGMVFAPGRGHHEGQSDGCRCKRYLSVEAGYSYFWTSAAPTDEQIRQHLPKIGLFRCLATDLKKSVS